MNLLGMDLEHIISCDSFPLLVTHCIGLPVFTNCWFLHSIIARLELRLEHLRNNAETTEIIADAPESQIGPGLEASAQVLPNNVTIDSLNSLSLHTISEGTSKSSDSRTRSVYVAFLDAALRAGVGNSAQTNIRHSEIGMTDDDIATSQHHFRCILDILSPHRFDRSMRILTMLGPIVNAATTESMVMEFSEGLANDNVAEMVSKRPDDVALTYLIAAAIVLFEAHHQFMETDLQHLIPAARSWLRATALKAKSFRMAQCLAVLTILSTIHPAYGSAWHLLSLAIIECLSLGLHTQDPHSTISDDERLETESLLWSVFVLDR